MSVVISAPFPLGKISPTAGTPLGVFENYASLANDRYAMVAWIEFQSHPSNTGKVYIGNADLDVATDVGILHVLMNPGDSISYGSTALNVFDPNCFMCDCETTGDSVLVSIHIR